mgnify:CR=1 FL=1
MKEKPSIMGVRTMYYKERDIYLLVIDFYDNDTDAPGHTSHILDNLSEVIQTLEQFANYREFLEGCLTVTISE